MTTSLADHELNRVLRAAVRDLDDVFMVTDADLENGPTIVAVNVSFEEMTGYTADEVLGLTPRILQGPDTERDALDELRAALERGERFDGSLTNYTKAGDAYRVQLRIVPVRDDDGSVTHFVSLQRDVTAEYASREALARDAAISAEVEERSARIVAEVHPVGAARAIVAQIAQLRPDLSVTMAYRSSGPEGEQITATVSAGDRPVVLTRVLRPDELVTPAATNPEAGDTGDIPIEWPDGVSVQATSTLRGRLGNAQAVLWVTGSEPLDLLTSRVVDGLADLGGYVIESAVLYSRERNVGSVLQRSLLATVDSHVEGFEVATRYFVGDPGLQVGGDWYDVIGLDESVVFVVGDVMGHGVRAAASMGELRSAVRSALRLGTSVAGAIEHVNRVAIDAHVTATLLCCQVRGGARIAEIWCAGHLPPVRVSAAGAVDVLPVEPVSLLGAVDGDLAVTSSPVPLSDDDTMLLFTDGLVERRGEGIDTGLQRLIDAVPSVPLALEDLVDHVYERTALQGEGADDTAILAFRRR